MRAKNKKTGEIVYVAYEYNPRTKQKQMYMNSSFYSDKKFDAEFEIITEPNFQNEK